MLFRSLLSVVALTLLAGSAQVYAQAAKPPGASTGFAEIKPELAGFSSQRLARLDTQMQKFVDDQQLAGAITLIARHGKIVQEKAYGYADLASRKPMQKDTIVRIYSMSKPITGVAMMMLYEEGKWKPSDPIERYIPEFRDLKVFAGVDKDGKPILEKPHHAPTVGELMSHSAGFTYGLFGSSPVDKMYTDANLFASPSLHAFVERVAQLPLVYQPGEGWVYSISVDIQGYLVEKLSGKSFPQFLRERIFEPLGMKDTGFSVPEEKLGRVATIYRPTDNGLTPIPRDPDISKLPALPSGGGGLYSTAGDYLRFTQMVLNGGELNGVRLLSPSTVELMRSNHLTDEVKNANKYSIGIYRMQPGLGFGYDFAVYEDPAKVGSTVGKGTFLWAGIAGTWFWIDPTNDVIFIGMIQRWSGGGFNIEDLARALTYQALVEPKK